jgi:hypothetical protein
MRNHSGEGRKDAGDPPEVNSPLVSGCILIIIGSSFSFIITMLHGNLSAMNSMSLL